MASSATLGHNALLSGATNFPLAGGVLQMKSISIDGVGADAVDITNMDSTSGWSEAIPGIKRAGTITVTAVYKESEYDLAIAAIGATPEVWTIVFAGATKDWVQTGFISDVGLVAENEGALEYTLTLTMTGAPAFDAI